MYGFGAEVGELGDEQHRAITMKADVTSILGLLLVLGCCSCDKALVIEKTKKHHESERSLRETTETISPEAEKAPSIRFGIDADPHLHGRTTPDNEAMFKRFVDAMVEWKPDFVIDLGDFAVQQGGSNDS